MELEDLLAEMAWLEGLAARLAPEPEAGRDAVQQTYLTAVERGPRAPGNARAWLSTVLRNALRGGRRSERRRRERELQWAAERARCHEEPMDVSERFALEHDLARAVLALDPDSRRLVLLRFHEGLTLHQVAERTGLPPSTADARIQRALGRLRERLDRDRSTPGFVPWLLAWLARPRVRGAGLVLTGSLGLLALTFVGPWAPGRGTDALPPAGGSSAGGTAGTVLSAAGGDRVRLPLEPPTPGEPGEPTPTSLTVRLLDPDGSPLRDIPVSLEPFDGAPPAPARSDVRGEVHFDRLQPGMVFVRPDRSGPQGHRLGAGRQHRVEVVLEGPALTGRVLDAAGGPVAGAEVWVSSRPAHWLQGVSWLRDTRDDVTSVWTEVDGTFRVPWARGVHVLGARAPGHGTVCLRLTQGVPRKPVDLVLGPAAGRLAGRVLGPGGEAIPQAEVLLERVGGRHGAPSPLTRLAVAGDGTFVDEGLEPGARTLHVFAPGFAPWHGTVGIEAARTRELVVQLGSGAVVAGRVLDAGGKPVVGAQVQCRRTEVQVLPRRAHDHGCVTDEDGRFRLEDLSGGRLQVVVAHRGKALVETVLSSVPGRVHWLDLRAEAPAWLEGTLVDERGQPLGGLSVRTRHTAGGPQHLASPLDGSFRLERPPGAPVYLTVFEKRQRVAGRWILPGEQDPVLTVPDGARPGSGLTGRLLGPDGAVPGGASLRLDPIAPGAAPRPPKRVPLEVDGSFAVEDLPPGEYHASAVWAGTVQAVFGGRVRLAPRSEAELGTWTLEPTGTLDLEVACGAGRAPETLAWRVLDTRGVEVHRADGRTFGAGAWRLELPGGAARLQVWSPDHAPWTGTVQVTAGETQTLQVDLTPGSPVDLGLRRPPGAPLATLALTLSDAAGKALLDVNLGPHMGERDAGYRLRLGLPPGRVHLEARADGMQLERWIAVAEPGQGLELTLQPSLGPR